MSMTVNTEYTIPIDCPKWYTRHSYSVQL
uniref:Uncharacterized protein n=1 Tax=Arundo donax TaxID=35708 RepID=A0A0A8ZAM7_ARUDO